LEIHWSSCVSLKVMHISTFILSKLKHLGKKCRGA
jgi:hypothetical protein